MKRVFLILLFFFVFVLSACKASASIPEIAESFEAVVTIPKKDTDPEGYSLQAELAVENRAFVEITITSPSDTEGLTYIWDDGFEMVYKDLHLQTEVDYLPNFSSPQVIYNVLQSVYANPNGKLLESGEAIFSGSSDSGEYEVLTDSKGNIKNISIKETGFYADFE